MKKILPLIAILIAVIIAFAFSVSYKNKKAQENNANYITTEAKSTEIKQISSLLKIRKAVTSCFLTVKLQLLFPPTIWSSHFQAGKSPLP